MNPTLIKYGIYLAIACLVVYGAWTILDSVFTTINKFNPFSSEFGLWKLVSNPFGTFTDIGGDITSTAEKAFAPIEALF